MRSKNPSGATGDARRLAAAGLPPAEDGAARIVFVWDLPTRLFHWLVAALVPAAYLTWRLNWMDWHARVGDGLLAVLLFRLLWGFFGSQTARFSGFLGSPRAALRHLARVLCREPDVQVGHNPAGGWMVVLLLALLFGQTLTGLYVDNDVANEGPLTEVTPARIANLITALHDKVLWDALLAAAALHVLAILVYGAAKGHNLLVPMITGCKRLPVGAPVPRLAPPTRALVLFAGAAAAAAALADFL